MLMPVSYLLFRFRKLPIFSVIPTKVIAIISLLIVGLMPKVWAAQPYTLAQIQAERNELQVLTVQGTDVAIRTIDDRIASVINDPARLAGLHLHKAFLQRDIGLPIIKENVTKALSMINEQQQPELYLLALTIEAYDLSYFQDKTQEAVTISEYVHQHPALRNDLFVQVLNFIFLLDSYYRLDQHEKVAKSLYQLAKLVASKSKDPLYKSYQHLVDQELATHSGRIGDVKQSVALYLKLIDETRSFNSPLYTAHLYCEMANLNFLPLSERFQYAKASLAAKKDTSCSDMMEKLVLLEEVQQGNLNNIARLSQIDSTQQFIVSNEYSAYYAGLAYLHLNDLASVQNMLKRLTHNNSLHHQDLLQQLSAKKGDYKAAFIASQKYNELLAKNYENSRQLITNSYQTRLELAKEETQAAEQAKHAEIIAVVEQKSQFRFHLILTLISAGCFVSLVLIIYFYRSQQVKSQLQQMSDTDPLTGLLNRRAFLRQAEQLKLLAERQQFPLSLALIDLDFFKKINDQYGHQMGDAVLCAFANSAKATVRKTDIVSRYGGEEFILTSTQEDKAEFVAILKRLQHCFETMCLQDKNIRIQVSFSAGIASITQPNDTNRTTIEDAIKIADSQLYRAKGNGRRQVCSEDLSVQLTSLETQLQ